MEVFFHFMCLRDNLSVSIYFPGMLSDPRINRDRHSGFRGAVDGILDDFFF